MARKDLYQGEVEQRADANAAEIIAELAQRADAPTKLDPSSVYERVIPLDARADIIDLEHLLPAPRRPAGVALLHTVQALADYTTRHLDSDRTTIWADAQQHTITTIVNDHRKHAGDAAGWGDHRAELKLTKTPEWLHWLGANQKMMDQQAFAEHIETGIDEVIEPSGAAMLEVAQSIRGSVNAEFQGGVRLHDGQVAVRYVEEQSAKAGSSGELEIPEKFELAIPPFQGEIAYKIEARLRYRLSNGSITLGYKLKNPERVILDAVEQITQRLLEQFPGLVFVGSPRPFPTGPAAR